MSDSVGEMARILNGVPHITSQRTVCYNRTHCAPDCPACAWDKMRGTLTNSAIRRAQERLNQKWLKEAHQLLTDAGVPEAVELVGEEVPTNTVPGRLKWYLLRRKNVAKAELDDADLAWLRLQRSLHTPLDAANRK